MTTTEMLTEDQLAEIETRARVATPPPWLVNPDQRKYVLMPFSSEEDVLRDRDANAAFCANARDDVPRLVAEIRRLRAELQPLQESDTYGWQPMMREIAKLSDALGLDDGDWSDADDSTLLEQFDPWAVIRSAIERASAFFDCDLNQMEAAFGQNILRRWDRDRITKFAAWLLGEDQTTALNHLDTIIAATREPGLGVLIVAIRLAKEWRGVVTSISNSQKE